MSGIMLEPYILPDYSDLIVTSLWPHFDLTGIMLRIGGIIPKWPYFSLKSWGKCELYWTYQCYIELGHTNHCNPHSIHIQTYIMRVKHKKNQPFGNGLFPIPSIKMMDFPVFFPNGLVLATWIPGHQDSLPSAPLAAAWNCSARCGGILPPCALDCCWMMVTLCHT